MTLWRCPAPRNVTFAVIVRPADSSSGWLQRLRDGARATMDRPAPSHGGNRSPLAPEGSTPSLAGHMVTDGLHQHSYGHSKQLSPATAVLCMSRMRTTMRALHCRHPMPAARAPGRCSRRHTTRQKLLQRQGSRVLRSHGRPSAIRFAPTTADDSPSAAHHDSPVVVCPRL